MEIYIDTNGFFYFFVDNHLYSKGVKKIFEKINRGEYKAFTSCFTLEELAYIVLIKLIEKKYNKNPQEVLRENRNVISEFSRQIQEMFAVIYSFENLEIVNSDKNQVWYIPKTMEENLLLPRDSIHLQAMKELKISHILSTDSDFDNIEDIKRINPEEI